MSSRKTSFCRLDRVFRNLADAPRVFSAVSTEIFGYHAKKLNMCVQYKYKFSRRGRRRHRRGETAQARVITYSISDFASEFHINYKATSCSNASHHFLSTKGTNGETSRSRVFATILFFICENFVSFCSFKCLQNARNLFASEINTFLWAQ